MNYRHLIALVAIFVVGIVVGYAVTIAIHPPKVVTTVETITVTKPIELKRISVIDAFGRLIDFERTPSKVVSLAPSITEKLFALGLDEVVIGVDSFSNYPQRVLELVNAGKITVVGGPWTPDAERIIALKPDVVLMCRGVRPQETLYPKLEEVGIRTVFLLCDNARNLYDVLSDFHTIGTIFGVEEKAKMISIDIEKKVSEILLKLKEANISKRRMLILIGPPSWGIYSAGGDTFIGWLVDTVGGINIAGIYSGWPRLDYEFILRSDPEVIVITAHGIDPREVYRELLGTPIIRTSAWLERKVYLFTGEANDVLSRPGPRIVVALEILAHILHPEVFGELQRADVYRIAE